MNDPQENSPVVNTPTTRSGGGSRVLMSATCAATSVCRKTSNLPVEIGSFDLRGFNRCLRDQAATWKKQSAKNHENWWCDEQFVLLWE